MKKHALLFLCAALLLASCTTFSKTDEIVDCSFSDIGTEVQSGSLVCNVKDGTMKGFFKKKAKSDSEDICLEGRRKRKPFDVGFSVEFMGATSVKWYDWNGKISHGADSDAVSLSMAVITQNSASIMDKKQYVLKSGECGGMTVEVPETVNGMVAHIPYTAMLCKTQDGKTLHIVAVNDCGYTMTGGEGLTAEQIEKNRPHLKIKEALTMDNQKFQVVDEENKVLADFTKTSYTLYDYADGSSRDALNAIGVFAAWICAVAEHENTLFGKSVSFGI